MTEIITRAQAKQQNLPKYYTGKLCVNGHITYRYTKSGTCAGCIAASVGTTRDAARENVAERAQLKRDAMAGLAEVKVRAYLKDWLLVKETAIGLCLARYPVLAIGDVVSKRAPIDFAGGTMLYRVYVPTDDVQLILDTANVLLSQNGIDIQAERARILHAAAGLADAEATMPPEDITK